MKNKPLLVQLLSYSYGIIVLLLVVTSLFYYKSSSQTIRQETERNTQNTIQQSSQFIDTYIQHLEETSASLVDKPSLFTVSNQEQVKQLFKTILATNSDLKTITYVSKEGNVLTTDESTDVETSSDMMKEDWYSQAIGKKATPVLLPAHMQKKDDMNDWVISITQEVQDSSGKNQGVLKIDLGYSSIGTYLKDLKLGQEGFAFIINQKGQYIYHPKESVYSSEEEMDEMKTFISAQNAYVQNGRYYVSQISMPSSQWIIVGVSSLDQLRVLRQNLIMSFIIIGFLIILGASLLITFGARQFLAPVKNLQETILKIGAGERNLRAEVAGPVELQTLSLEFNKMLDQNDSLMQSIKESQEEIRQYELQALASQINPHFLYNTLDSIIWMAEFKDNQRVVEMTKSLAAYFRLALNQGNEKITLKKEIDHVRHYLFIQKQRYGNRLSYEISEDDKADDFILPKLVLQPLVENAIYHGIKEVDRPGLIKIKTSLKNNILSVSVWDNGKGFDEKTSSQDKLDRGGVGLSNVKKRLSLEFGEDFDMMIQSEKNQFTQISLIIKNIKK